MPDIQSGPGNTYYNNTTKKKPLQNVSKQESLGLQIKMRMYDPVEAFQLKSNLNGGLPLC